MANNNAIAATKAAAVPAETAQAVNYIDFKNRITSVVMKRIGELQQGGISMPKGYSTNNQIQLAFLKLASLQDKNGQPILPTVTPQSVANALLTMCIKGLSLEKSQCAFVKYGNELQLQTQYQGTIAMAKRYGAGDPQAQVIYQDDDFEYTINPRTGKKEIIRHDQKLANISNDKIIGAWCIVPYAEHPEWEPKVEVMTIAEIRQSWAQGKAHGESVAHRNFTQEMAKKTVIGRACKLFIETSSDAGIYDDDRDDAEFQAQPDGGTAPAAQEVELPPLPAVKADTLAEEVAEPAAEPQAGGAEAPQEDFSEDMFNPDFK